MPSLILVLALFIGDIAAAWQRCEQGFLILSQGEKVAVVPRDTGIEVEQLIVQQVKRWYGKTAIIAQPDAIAMFTTTDGTVGPVLGKAAAPSFVQKIAQAKNVAPQRVAWDDLTPPQQREVLRLGAEARNASDGRSLFEDPNIPGLKVRDRLKVRFTKETVFLGQTYPPGEHWIDAAALFAGRLHYASPGSAAQMHHVEVHLQFGAGSKELPPMTAGQVSEATDILFEGLGLGRPAPHAHVVGALPVARLRADFTAGLALVEKHRHVNLASELIAVIEHGGELKPKEEKSGGLLWDSLRPDDLIESTEWVRDIRRGGSTAFGKRKPTFVRLRGPETYKSPEPLVGFEVRFLPTEGDPRLNRAFLDRTQAALGKENFGVDPKRLEAWMAKLGFKAEDFQRNPQLIGGHWYNHPWEVISKQAPPELRAFANPSPLNPLLWGSARKLRKLTESHEEVKMLFYDWSTDFLVFDQPELAVKIRSEQVTALKKLRSGQDPWVVMQHFLRESGLYERVLSTL